MNFTALQIRRILFFVTDSYLKDSVFTVVKRDAKF